MADLLASCPQCSTALKMSDASLVGKQVRCPNCSTVFTFQPDAPASAPPLAPPPPANDGGDALSFLNEPATRSDSGEAPRRRRPTGGGGGGKAVLWVVLGAVVLVASTLGGLWAAGIFDGEDKPGDAQAKGQKSKPSDKGGQGGTGPNVPSGSTDLPKPTLPKPDFEMSVLEYFNEHEKDKEAARVKYEGKIIQLTGTIHRMINRPMSNLGHYFMKSPQFNTFTCTLKPGSNYWFYAIPGQKIVIRGKPLQDVFVGQGLVECEVVSREGAAPPRFTAAKLAQLVESGSKEVPAEDTWVVVTGKVKKLEHREDLTRQKVHIIDFEGTAKHDVEAEFEFQSIEEGNLKVGDQLTVVGKLAIRSKEDGIVLGNILATELPK